MGLIRKGLYLGTGGIVAPNSKKQRMAIKQLAAMQGRTEKEIRRAGGRYDPNVFGNPADAGVKPQLPQRRSRSKAGAPAPQRDDGELWAAVWAMLGEDPPRRNAAIAIQLGISVEDVKRYIGKGKPPAVSTEAAEPHSSAAELHSSREGLS